VGQVFRLRILVPATILLAFLVIAYFWGSVPPEVALNDPAYDIERATTELDDHGYDSGFAYGASSELESDGSRCIDRERLQSHPMMSEERQRLDRFSTQGATISSYRHLSSSDLLALAEQGDSAAMAVLGAVYEMRARHLPDSKAVPFLKGEATEIVEVYISKQPVFDTESANVEEAARWYYQAALHGRLEALRHFGLMLDYMQKTPVDLGLISKQDLDSAFQSGNIVFIGSEIQPENFPLISTRIYVAAIYAIAPEYELGLVDERDSHGIQEAKGLADVVAPIVHQYSQDRAELGLPPISVPESGLPSRGELKELLCGENDAP